jgi:hypothetical protein
MVSEPGSSVATPGGDISREVRLLGGVRKRRARFAAGGSGSGAESGGEQRGSCQQAEGVRR